MRRTLLTVVAVAMSTLGGVARAEDLDGRAIMTRVDRQNRPKDEKATVAMELVGARGDRRSRELETFFKAGEGDDDRLLVRFLAPGDVKGMGLLTLEKDDGEEEQYLYIPELKKSKRIAGATRSQSFAGTELSYGDMRTEDLKRHEYRLEGEAEEGGRACYVVTGTPANEDVAEETGYGKRTLHVDKERWIVVRVDFYDRSGKLLKVQTSSGHKQISGYWRANEMVVENRQTGAKTRLVYDKGREIDTGLPDRLFTKRELEK